MYLHFPLECLNFLCSLGKIPKLPRLYKYFLPFVLQTFSACRSCFCIWYEAGLLWSLCLFKFSPKLLPCRFWLWLHCCTVQGQGLWRHNVWPRWLTSPKQWLNLLFSAEFSEFPFWNSYDILLDLFFYLLLFLTSPLHIEFQLIAHSYQVGDSHPYISYVSTFCPLRLQQPPQYHHRPEHICQCLVPLVWV